MSKFETFEWGKQLKAGGLQVVIICIIQISTRQMRFIGRLLVCVLPLINENFCNELRVHFGANCFVALRERDLAGDDHTPAARGLRRDTIRAFLSDRTSVVICFCIVDDTRR